MVLGLGVLGSPWGWVRCPDDLCFLGRLAQEDRLTTGAAGVVFVLCFCFLTTFLLELDKLACYLGFDQLGTFFKVRPPLFCRFFFGFFWPSGASSSSSFSSSSSSSSSGWVGLPLPRFSLRFPLGSWAGGRCVFVFFCCALLLLASSL